MELNVPDLLDCLGASEYGLKEELVAGSMGLYDDLFEAIYGCVIDLVEVGA